MTMSGAIAGGDQQLPNEFDDVTAEIKYPPITARTTEKEFVRKAGNGYLLWVAGASVVGVGGVALFVWGVHELVKWL
jgi:hypothetical protein